MYVKQCKKCVEEYNKKGIWKQLTEGMVPCTHYTERPIMSKVIKKEDDKR